MAINSLLEKTQDNSSEAFIPVAMRGRSDASAVEIHLGKILTMRVPTSVSPRWLAEFVHNLRA